MNIRETAQEQRFKLIAQGRHNFPARSGGQLRGARKSHGGGNILSPGTPLALMSPSKLNSLQRSILTNEQRADTFGSEDFVRAERVEVDTQERKVDRNLAECLSAIGMKINILTAGPALCHKSCNFRYWLNLDRKSVV